MFHGDRRKLIPLTYINNGYIRRKRHTDEFKSKNMKGIDVKKKKKNKTATCSQSKDSWICPDGKPVDGWGAGCYSLYKARKIVRIKHSHS